VVESAATLAPVSIGGIIGSTGCIGTSACGYSCGKFCKIGSRFFGVFTDLVQRREESFSVRWIDWTFMFGDSLLTSLLPINWGQR